MVIFRMNIRKFSTKRLNESAIRDSHVINIEMRRGV